MDYAKTLVLQLPDVIIKMILEKKLIENALNTNVAATEMELLFDIYENFVDKNGEFDNWECYQCRNSVLENFKKMHPYMVQYALENKL
jgi:hypothetical protein